MGYDRCLARWPYGSDKIWLFYVNDDSLWYARLPTALRQVEVAEVKPAPVVAPLPITPDVKPVQLRLFGDAA